MKRQGANNKLAFNSLAITELNENQLHEVNGGASVTTIVYQTISITLY
jgi:hypothetical protein